LERGLLNSWHDSWGETVRALQYIQANETVLRIGKKFLKSSVIYTVAGSLPMASALILLPFYVEHLSTSDFGALSIYFAFSYFVQLLTTYSFDTSLYVHYHEFKKEPLRLASFTSSSFLFMLLIGSGVGLIL